MSKPARSIVSLIFLMTCIVLSARADTNGQPILNQIVIIIGEYELKTEVALTPRQRFNGLSFRKSLAENAAMLFVYEETQPLHFTMKDASIPLSIAFISDSFVINEILDMTPHTVGPWSSSKPAKFALEVNQGWFAARGIEKGDQIKFRELK